MKKVLTDRHESRGRSTRRHLRFGAPRAEANIGSSNSGAGGPPDERAHIQFQECQDGPARSSLGISCLGLPEVAVAHERRAQARVLTLASRLHARLGVVIFGPLLPTDLHRPT